MSTELVMPSNHLIHCCPLLLPPSAAPSMAVKILYPSSFPCISYVDPKLPSRKSCFSSSPHSGCQGQSLQAQHQTSHLGTGGSADWAGRALGFGPSDPDLASRLILVPLWGCITSGGLPFRNGEKDSGAEVTWCGLRALLPETPSSGCGVEGGQHLPALSFLGAEVTPPVLCSSPESLGPERGVQ